MPAAPWKTSRAAASVSDEITQDDVEAFLRKHYGSDAAATEEEDIVFAPNATDKTKVGTQSGSAAQSDDDDQEIEYSDKDVGETLVLCNLLQEMGDDEEKVNGGEGAGALEGPDCDDTNSVQRTEDLYKDFYEPGSPSSAKPLSTSREMGTVEKFAPKRGFGVIKPDDGESSIFVHWTQICSHDKWPQLSPGMRVEYVKTADRGRLAATSVTGPGGSLIVTAEAANDGHRKLSPFTLTGTATWFHKAGYGFIRIDSKMEWPQQLSAGSEIYVSREDLVVAEGCPCGLEPGMRVQFKVYKPKDREVAAAEVTALGGGPLTRGSASRHASSSSSWNSGSADRASSSSWHARDRSWCWDEGSEDCESSSPWYANARPRASSSSWYTGTADRASSNSWHKGGFKGKPKSSGIGASCGKGALSDRRGCDSSIVSHLLGVQRVITKRAEPPMESGQSSSACQSRLVLLQRNSRRRSEQWPRVRKFFGQMDDLMEESYNDAIDESEPCHETRERARRSSMVLSEHFEQGGYSDDDLEVAELPTRAASPGFSQSAGPTCKKVPCRFHAEGRCRKGDHCPFSHSPESLQPIPLEKKVSMECEFYEKGRCTRGAACPFAHGPQELYDINQLKAQKREGASKFEQLRDSAPALD